MLHCISLIRDNDTALYFSTQKQWSCIVLYYTEPMQLYCISQHRQWCCISPHRDNEVVFLYGETMKLYFLTLRQWTCVVFLSVETMKLYFSTQRQWRLFLYIETMKLYCISLLIIMLYCICHHRGNESVFLYTATMKLYCISLHRDNEVVLYFLYTETMKLYFSKQKQWSCISIKRKN